MTILKNIYRSKVLLILIAMFVTAAIFVPYFFTLQNLINLVTYASIYAIMAFGMTFVILARELDLSVGAVMAFTGVLLVRLIPYTGVAAAIAAILLVGVIIGMISGFLVSKIRLNSFVVTLSVMFFYNGLALHVADGQPILSQDPFLNWLGNGVTLAVPNQIWLAVILFVVTDYTLRKTKFGRNVYAVGGDEKVAALTGISVNFYKISVFVIAAVASAIGGILLTGMQNSASPIAGSTAALSIVSSVVIGGTSLAGGEGGVTRTVIGLFIFSILDNSLSLLNVSPFHQTLIKGVLLVLVIGWDYYARKVRAAHSLA
ncbi:ABC transporter permease [Ferviditalea candida]|uniref:ABC transporter permease n=1 Tax=Ferviditalea candida TaxID=3108399 RepID=A0ABU5ZDI7_9BACL|nr:ABC transporter permease [Paenibacillaceae bacterium T2]